MPINLNIQQAINKTNNQPQQIELNHYELHYLSLNNAAELYLSSFKKLMIVRPPPNFLRPCRELQFCSYIKQSSLVSIRYIDDAYVEEPGRRTPSPDRRR